MPKPISGHGNSDFEPLSGQMSRTDATPHVETQSEPAVPSDLAGLKAWLRENPSPARQAIFKQRLSALRTANESSASDSASDWPYENPLPGCYTITDKTRGIDIRLTVGNPDAKDGVQELITLTEAFSGGLPKGSGSDLVVKLLRHFGISLRPGGKLVCTSIREESTVRAYAEYMLARASARDSAIGPAAAQTKIGRFTAAIVSRLGLEVESIDWPSGSADRIEITATTRCMAPGLAPPRPFRLPPSPQQDVSAERRSPPED